MKLKNLFCIVLCVALVLSGCSMANSNEAPEMDIVLDSISTDGKLRTTFESQEISVVIDAAVAVPEDSNIKVITLEKDDALANRFIEEQIKEPYPGATSFSESGRESWTLMDGNNAIFMAGVSDDGQIDFTDVVNDISAPYLDGSHLFEYGYITSSIPAHMEITASEAAEQLCAFIEPYSSLAFRPWNVLVAQNADRPDQSGYYDISLQAYYNGMPINVKSNIKDTYIRFNGCVSNKGIFFGYGTLLLSLKSEKAIKGFVSLENALETVRENIGFMAYGDSIEISRISLEYIPEITKGSDYLLRPAWVFTCHDTGADGATSTYEYVIYADDGSFCGMFF